MSAGQRRGAMMACLRIDHPDIGAFIDAKRDPARFRNFNLSALVPDAFMAALAADQEWPLRFGGIVHGVVRAAKRRLCGSGFACALVSTRRPDDATRPLRATVPMRRT